MPENLFFVWENNPVLIVKDDFHGKTCAWKDAEQLLTIP